MTPRSLFSTPPLWREHRYPLELAALMRSRTYRGEGIPDGGGQPVFLIPGFLAGDDSLTVMTRWLRRHGYYTSRAGIRSNIDCSEAAVDRLAERLETMAETQGRKVAIIGQSRGGNFAKVLAVRRPDLVSGIVTLGSPQLDPVRVHPLVRAQVYAVGALGTLRIKGLFKHSCLWGECCRTFWDELRGPIPDGVGYLSIYSRTDGVVDWRSCLDEAAQLVEVSSSHCGMSVSAQVYRELGFALAAFGADEVAWAQAA
jgi:pimeloyl-ACP methyl ester carboxylesterase